MAESIFPPAPAETPATATVPAALPKVMVEKRLGFELVIGSSIENQGYSSMGGAPTAHTIKLWPHVRLYQLGMNDGGRAFYTNYGKEELGGLIKILTTYQRKLIDADNDLPVDGSSKRSAGSFGMSLF